MADFGVSPDYRRLVVDLTGALHLAACPYIAHRKCLKPCFLVSAEFSNADCDDVKRFLWFVEFLSAVPPALRQRLKGEVFALKRLRPRQGAVGQDNSDDALQTKHHVDYSLIWPACLVECHWGICS